MNDDTHVDVISGGNHEDDDVLSVVDDDASDILDVDVETGDDEQPSDPRLSALNRRLELYPESSSLHLLRGEFFMRQGAYHVAQSDFEQALTLALAALPDTSWGFVEQSVIDRAQQALKQLTMDMETSQ